MVDKAKWYALYVNTGRELNIMKALQRKGISAVVPLENRAIRSKGKWITKEYVIFKGYVFVNLEYNWLIYYEISKINGVIRLLGGGHSPEPLPEHEVERLIKSTKLFAELSTVRLFDSGYEVLNGVLLTFKDCIKSLDRHAHRAVIETNIAGKPTEFTLSFMTEQTLANGKG